MNMKKNNQTAAGSAPRRGRLKKILSDRRFKYGTFATVVTVAFVAVIFAVNILASYLVSRYPLKIDLTANQVYKISDETKKLLDKFDQGDKEINIYLLGTKEDYTPDLGTNTSTATYIAQASEMIDNFAKLSSHVKVHYIDMVKNPAFMSKYPKEKDIKQMDIIVDSGDKYKVVALQSLFLTNTAEDTTDSNTENTVSILASVAEQTMAGAMMYVTSDQLPKAILLQGHDETTDQVEAILGINNFDILKQTVINEKLDPSANMAIIANPQRDFSSDELKKLDDFLINNEQYGKSLFVTFSPEQPELPNLEGFLAEWGIKVDTGIVYETDNSKYRSTYANLAFASIEDTNFGANLTTTNAPLLYGDCRPVERLFEKKGDFTTYPIVQFADTARLTDTATKTNWAPSETDKAGPFLGAVVSSYIKYSGANSYRSMVYVSGSSEFYDNDYISDPTLTNGQYLTNALNILSQRTDDYISLVPKEIADPSLGITYNIVIVMGVVFVVLIPAAVLVWGGIVWLKRRHL